MDFDGKAAIEETVLLCIPTFGGLTSVLLSITVFPHLFNTQQFTKFEGKSVVEFEILKSRWMRVQASTVDSVQTDRSVADSENKLKIWAGRENEHFDRFPVRSKHSREEIYLQNREKIFGKQPYAVFPRGR